MKHKTLINIIVVVILLLAGYWYFQHNSEPQNPMNGGAQGQQAISVSSMLVKQESVSLTMTLPGRTSAYQQSQVRPQVSGIIKERLFTEGAEVEKGEPLYQLDDAQYVANLKSAQANLQSAKANLKAIQARYNRIKSLEAKQAVSEQDFDDVEAQLDQARANISVAEAAVAVQQINVDYTRVYAPIAGRIGKSKLTVGALVTASQPEALAVITQLNPMYVDMQVAGEDVRWIQQQLNADAEIAVRLSNFKQDSPVSGVLEFSDVNVDETTGSVGLRALMDNTDGSLLPGLFVNAELSLGTRSGVLVPQRATTRTAEGELQVWVVEKNNQVKPQILKVNRALGNQWVVIGGLEGGEQIVVEGYQRLSAGSEVMTTPWQQDSPSEGKSPIAEPATEKPATAVSSEQAGAQGE